MTPAEHLEAVRVVTAQLVHVRYPLADVWAAYLARLLREAR